MNDLSKTARYDRMGVQAINPQAFDLLFALTGTPETADVDGVPVVPIHGPLTHHGGMWCDNYDAITRRVAEALEKPSAGIVLSIDSPGGDVSGCMEAARAIRAMADVAQKRVVVYVDGQACSAGYALACVADAIVVPPSATMGSIGVLSARRDVSAAMTAEGLAVHLVKSGARKGDGDPSQPASTDELAAIQDVVDTLAGLLFDHVAAHRSALTAEACRDMQAGLRIGADAVTAGLADMVGTLDDALALARGEAQITAANPPQEGSTMATMEEALDALRAAAEGEDEEMAARAKRMLAAMDPEEEPAAEDPEEDKPSDPPPPEKKDDEDAKAIAARALATAQATQRTVILATRPDLSAEAVANLKGVPTEALASVLKTIPRATAPVMPKAAAPTRGDGQGGESYGVTFGSRVLEPNEALDRAMGMSKSTEAPIKRTAHYTQFGTLTREQANETLKKIGGAR